MNEERTLEKELGSGVEKDDAAGRFLRDMLAREESETRDKAIRYGLQALKEAKS